MAINIRETTNKSTCWTPNNNVQARRTFEACCDAGETASQIRAELYAQHGVAIDTTLEAGSAALCSNIGVDSAGGGIWNITVSYAVPNNGSWSAMNSGINAPMVVRIESNAITDRTDRDADGNPFLNTAGIPYDDPQEVQLIAKRFSVAKNFATAQLGAFVPYENSVADSAITLKASRFKLDADIVIPADSLLFIAVQADEYSVNATCIRHVFTFEYRIWQMNGAAIVAPFEYRFANKSTWGNSADGIGPLCNSQGVILEKPEYLDNQGKPQNGNVKVKFGSKVASPIAVEKPAGLELDGGAAYHVRYKRYGRKSFLPTFDFLFGA